jgi:hypothetical protein
MDNEKTEKDKGSTCESQHPPFRGGLGGLELKSPPVQEILGRPPRWIIRWGITVILIVIVGLFVGSYFFKYPDVISATIEVTTDNLPVQLVARATGKLDTLFVVDNEIVEKEQYLAVIENSANFEDVLFLKKAVSSFEFWVSMFGRADLQQRHCERSEAIQNSFSSTEAQSTQSFTEKMSIFRTWGCSKSSISRHCERSEAIQSVDSQEIASGYHPRNDVVTDFLNSPQGRSIVVP